ncbi:hypothetical protein CEXT_665421 [Caerostris extrusa]|uniref:Uncharacterized protein n=1 Tax=Caerostris extrusa TaxID=172846 RepID=A0AAV4WA43_CAEEX|nr:hypothetical protein CEXT_665421 [Caerostris extrusa]
MPGSHGVTLDGISTVALGEAPLVGEGWMGNGWSSGFSAANLVITAQHRARKSWCFSGRYSNCCLRRSTVAKEEGWEMDGHRNTVLPVRRFHNPPDYHNKV